MAWLVGYTTRKKITIDHTKIDADLTNFPVLVKLTVANFDFSKANADGFDIRFTSSDGETLLKYERERHDSGNEVAEYWVKVPVIDDAVDTDIYIYYRTTDTDDGADPTNVWDANFKGVWHLKDANDSTVNVNHLTKVGASEYVAGKISKCVNFADAGNNCLYNSAQWPNTAIQLKDPLTMECWAKLEIEPTGEHRILTMEGGGRYLTFYASPDRERWTAHDGSNFKDFYYTIDLDIATWYYLTWVSDGSNLKAYHNGAYVGQVAYTNARTTVTSFWIIGANSTDGSSVPFRGMVDETRVSLGARSAAWIKASYNSGDDTLLSLGSEETPPAVGRSHGYIF